MKIAINESRTVVSNQIFKRYLYEIRQINKFKSVFKFINGG